MKKILSFIIAAWVCTGVQARQTTYTIRANEPEWDRIPNLYVSPVLTLDVPFSNDGMNSSSLGWGIRSHAVVRGRFFADINYMGSLWNIVTNINTKPRLFEAGGAMLLKSNVREKTIPVVTSRKELSSVRYGDQVRTTEQVNYIDVPNGKELRFAGARGGLHTFRSIFEYSVPGTPPPGTDYNVPDEEVRGWTNAIGLYAGWTLGRVNNLQIATSDRRIHSEMKYNRWYADVLISGYKHNYIENHPTNDRKAIPVGFRIGFETTNKMTTGVLGKVIHAEVGYRPGFNGIYTTMGFSFFQVRSQLGVLM